MTNLEKAKFLGKIFVNGGKEQLKQPWTIGAAASIGLYQGLKYKGNIIHGIQGGFATLIVIAAANGIYNIVADIDRIREIFKEGA